MFLQDDEVFYSAQLIGNVQMPSYKSGVDITNSGSHVVGLDASIGKKMSDKISLVGQLHVPLYIGTQGTQVAESFTISGAITMSFGGERSSRDSGEFGDDDRGDNSSEQSFEDSEDAETSPNGKEMTEAQSEINRLQEEVRRLRAAAERPLGNAITPAPAPAKKSNELDAATQRSATPPIRTSRKGRFSVRVQDEKKDTSESIAQKAPVNKPTPKPEPVKVASPALKAKAGDVKDLARGGESFALQNAAVKGKVTVVDFWAEWCRPCKKITALLEELAAENSNIAVRKVEVPNFESAVAMQHLNKVSGLPVVWIYDSNGKLVQKLVGTNAKEVRLSLKQLLGK